MKSKFVSMWLRLLSSIPILATLGCDIDPSVLYVDLHFEDSWRVRGAKPSGPSSIKYRSFHWLSGGSSTSQDIKSDFRFFVSGEEFEISRLNPETIETIGLHQLETGEPGVAYTGRFLNGFSNIYYDEDGEIDGISIQFYSDDQFDKDYKHSIPKRFGIQFRGGPVIERELEEKETRTAVGIDYTKERQRGLEF